ncbi:MAG: formylglycine-generating enzyme family protein, partial [Verrucomicrobia bacterium]|nr:formylglycine-generating enzyme family protein [Verrucomicrobiota bacterium]
YDDNNYGMTSMVGQKLPNAWGFYEMHGNVFEWCLDWYGSYPTSSVTDPAGPSTGSSRMLRGGSWYDSADACRSAFRNCYYPSDYDYYIGFRVALSIVQ